MADIRKKLIDLLLSVPSAEVIFGKREGKRYTTAWHIANHLIANGVTIQEWIPVTERLPECFGTYIVAIHEHHGENRMGVDSADFDPFAKKWTTFNYWCAGMEVTHWMPMPEPPKGE